MRPGKQMPCKCSDGLLQGPANLLTPLMAHTGVLGCSHSAPVRSDGSRTDSTDRREWPWLPPAQTLKFEFYML